MLREEPVHAITKPAAKVIADAADIIEAVKQDITLINRQGNR